MKLLVLFILSIIIILPEAINAQDESVAWKRNETQQTEDLHLFRSTQSVSLPTAEFLDQGNFEFEISHRFLPTIGEGLKRLYGIDGPVYMRLALAYAISNDFTVALGRSNLQDNVDIWAKYKLFQIPNDVVPLAVGLRAGIGWNTLVFDNTGTERLAGDSRNFQYYGQLILNTVISKRLGIGLVPSYLYNSYIFTNDRQYSFVLGTNAVFYFSRLLGVIAEWSPVITGFTLNHNPVAFGIELNTGGHFFKIVMTNSYLLNPSQYLAGVDDFPFNEPNHWRIGFNITRLLKF